MRIGRLGTWRLPFTTTTPAVSLIRSCTRTRSRLISHSTVRKAAGRRCKRRRFTNAEPIFPRSTAMRLLAKRAPWVMRSRISVTRRAAIPDSRSGASRRSYSQSSANAAVNVMRQSRFLSKQRGRKPTDNEVAVLVRESRADKLAEISTQELRAKAAGSADSGRREGACLGRARRRRPTLSVASSSSSLDYAKDHIFERVSVAQDHELLTEALRHGRGRIRLNELKGELSVQESAGRVLRSGREIATETSLERDARNDCHRQPRTGRLRAARRCSYVLSSQTVCAPNRSMPWNSFSDRATWR